MTIRPQHPLRVRLLCLGDGGGRDLPAVVRALTAGWGAGGDLDLQILRLDDERARALGAVRRWCDRDAADVVLTVGRSGHLRADWAPGLAAAAITRPLPGVEERMHLTASRRPEDLLFRGRAGLRRTTLVVNLPARGARAAAVVRLLAPVLGHALEKARGCDRACGDHGGEAR